MPQTRPGERSDDELRDYLASEQDLKALSFSELKRLKRLHTRDLEETPAQDEAQSWQRMPAVTGTESYVPPDVALNRLLSLIGGTVGGFAGPVGAGIGGATGEALGQGAEYLLGTSDALSVPAIVKEGLLQGVFQAGPISLVRGAQRAARRVYRGTLKPSLSATRVKQARRIVETAFEEGLPITAGGRRKVEQLKMEIGRQINAEAKRLGGRVDLSAIATQLRQWAKDRYFTPGQSLEVYEKALAVADRIAAHPSLKKFPTAFPRQYVDLDEAVTIKRNLYEVAGDKAYGVEPALRAEAKASKEGARLFRRATEAEAGRLTGLPGAKTVFAQLNRREARLIDAARAILAAVEREANQYRLRDLSSYALAAGGGAGVGYAGGNPLLGAGLGLAARRALRPDVMTHLALLTDRIASNLGVAGPTAARLAYYVLTAEPSTGTPQPLEGGQ